MKWQTCQYAPLKPDCCDVGAVAGVVQQVHDQLFDVLSEGVDGDNVDERFIVAGGGLSWTWPRSNTGGWDKTKPKGLTTDIGNEKNDAYIKPKGNATTGLPKGMEIIVDPRDANGRVCVVAKSDTTKQIGSFIPEDPGTVANPKFTVYGNYGKAVFGTSGAFNWELHRNGAASMSDDGTALGTTRTLFRLGTLASSASYPALKALGAGIRTRLADDTADVSHYAGDFTVLDGSNNAKSTLDGSTLYLSGAGRIEFSTDATNVGDPVLRMEKSAAGALLLSDPQTSADPAIQLGGTTSSFPALKRSSAAMHARLADDSDYADLYGKTLYENGTALGSIYQPLDSDLTAIAALTTTAHGRGLLDDADAAASRASLALGTSATKNLTVTQNVLVRGDASGHLVDSAVTDNGSTVAISRTLVSSAGRAPSLNTETLSGNKTLTEASPTYQHLTPDANRDVTLPTTPTAGLIFMIRNAASSGFDLTVKDSGGSTEATLSDNEWAYFQYVSGTTWHSWGLF